MFLVGVLISFVNGDPHGECPIQGFEDGKFFTVGMRMKEKVFSKEVWGWGQYFTPRPAMNSSRKLY
jgi:hypothetical protein